MSRSERLGADHVSRLSGGRSASELSITVCRLDENVRHLGALHEAVLLREETHPAATAWSRWVLSGATLMFDKLAEGDRRRTG